MATWYSKSQNDALLGAKASTDSPALTGSPTVPTAAAGDASTKVASTQFVATAVAAATGTVTSVAGRTGAVVLAEADVANLTSDLSARIVAPSGGSAGQILSKTSNGYAWITVSSSAAASMGWANVKDYGAVGDGTTDDSTAFSNAVASGKTVYCPPGNYKVNTAGFDTYRPRIVGANKWDVTITLGAGVYFFDTTTFANQVYIAGITFSGGAGAIRLKSTAANVSDIHTVVDCSFLDYTVCAVSNNSNDMPLWKVQRNFFRGVNDTGTIGVALTGLTDTCNVSDNEFFTNAVHIKLGNGGNNAYVKHNDFIQGNSYNNAMRTMLWVVPRAQNNGGTTNAGTGMVAWDNKWGNENLGALDKRVLYADEGSGSYFGSRLPDVTNASTGYIIGHTVGGGAINGSTLNPVVYSMTPNMRGCHWAKDVHLGGGVPSMILQTNTDALAPDPEAYTNLVGPCYPTDGYWPPQRVSNSPALIAAVVDPNGYFDTASTVGFTNLVTARTTSMNAGGATLTTVADMGGGTEAVEFSTSAGTPYIYLQVAPTAGVPVTIEFDVRGGTGGTPLTVLELMFGTDGSYSGGPGNYLRRNVAVGTGWKRVKLRAVSATSGTNILIKFRASSFASGTYLQVGRVRAYHGDAQTLTDLNLPMATTQTAAPAAGGASALPATPAGYVNVNVGGTLRKVAYY